MDNSETDEPVRSADDLFLTAVLFEVALGLLALALGWGLGPDPRQMIPKFPAFSQWPSALAQLKPLWPIASGIFWGVLASIPILLLVTVVRRIPCEPVRRLERLGDDGTMKMLLSLRPMEMIAISLCAGIGEELLFRGWFMYWLQELHASVPAGEYGDQHQVFGTVAALLVSSVAFGLVHPITKLYVFLAAVMGLYFGGLVLWTGNLLVPIMAHATYDAVQMLMSSRSSQVETAT